MAVLLLPVTLDAPASLPTNTFEAPFELLIPASWPMKVLKLAVIFVSPSPLSKPARLPMKVLPDWYSLNSPADLPKKELLLPPLLRLPALLPKKALEEPFILTFPALDPKKEFWLPVFAAPAPTPPNKLPEPPLLNIRSPPMLN